MENQKQNEVRAQTSIKNVYIVQNWGVLRDYFYTLKEAIKYVSDEENHYPDRPELFQIYKADIEIKNPIQKKFKRTWEK